jgi:hypothetical protein
MIKVEKISDNFSREKLSLEETMEIIFKQNTCLDPIHIYCIHCFFSEKELRKTGESCLDSFLKKYGTLYMLNYLEKYKELKKL